MINNLIGDSEWTSSSGVTTVTLHVYDGSSLIADLSSGGAVEALYLDGDQPDQEIARLVASGQPNAGVAWNLVDRHGSVRDIMDDSGSLMDHLNYSGYGVLESETDPGVSGNYTYAGGWFAPITGDELFGRRWYDAATGDWLTVDPISFESGTSNLRGYTGNDPTNAVDPTGLYQQDVHFYMTFYIACALGLQKYKPDGTNSEAYTIAWADQYVDTHSYTEPIQLGPWYNYPTSFDAAGPDWFSLGFQNTMLCFFPFGAIMNQGWGVSLREGFHFPLQGNDTSVTPNSPRANAAVDNGIKAGNLFYTGIGLHTLQDSWAHQGYGPVFGHSFAADKGNAPDEPYRDVESAMKTAERTYEKLAEFLRINHPGASPAKTWEQISKDVRTGLEFEGSETERIANWQKLIEKTFSININYIHNGDNDAWAASFLTAARYAFYKRPMK